MQMIRDLSPVSGQSRGMLGAGVLIVIVALLTVVAYGGDGHSAGAAAKNVSLQPMCGLWDRQASEAVAQRVVESRNDTDLRQLNNTIFRMRRARRNCEIGWVRQACQDYIAVMRNVGGTSSEWPGSKSFCPLAMANEDTRNTRQSRR